MTNEEIFEQNTKIAYRIANRYKINYDEEIDDIRQVALMGLWKSILTWDHMHTLTTYAYVVIPREINMYLRSIKKYKQKCISIETPIFCNCDDELTILDVLEDPNDCIFNLLDEIDSKGVLDNIQLEQIERSIIFLRSKGFTQYEIGKVLNVSQAQVSRFEKKIKNKISNYINGKENKIT